MISFERFFEESAGDDPVEAYLAFAAALKKLTVELRDPLAAMCCHKDTHSSERLPELGRNIPKSPYEMVAPMGHKFGGWGA